MRISIIKVLTRKIPKSFRVVNAEGLSRMLSFSFLSFLNLCFERAALFWGPRDPNSTNRSQH